MTQTIEQNIENPDKAKVWLSRGNPYQTTTGALPNTKDMVSNYVNKNQSMLDEFSRQNRYKKQSDDFIFSIVQSHQEQGFKTFEKNVKKVDGHVNSIKQSLGKAASPYKLWQHWLSYTTNSSQRMLQTADVLRKRGDIFIEHERAGNPPVLDYDYDVILDASTFRRPSNYVLLKIKPPEGVKTDPSNRPYIIIDPRAGHGAGIGGFKPESQVGVALQSGHPVYFVAFKRLPEPTQTIADVTYAEAKFVREVKKRHPKASAPTLIGNCQGGWAALILAATNPDIDGPIIMNGAPVSAWSGEVGVNPLRYKAGVNGGTWLSMLSADLTNGLFDGAWLVSNFEQMNPYRNFIGKYYDLYQNPIANSQRFLDFERWWGGFFLMNEAEIRWIVENIFVGNRLARNTAQLEKGVNIDLRNIKAPIVVFASHGDDITPPPQALAWILDAYTDEKQVEVCGQRIVYMIHEEVGHLGIFVSSDVANREHNSIASIMDSIELLPPGLYEMDIKNVEGSGEDKTFAVDLNRRTFEDLNEAIGECRNDEKVFRAVHRASKEQTRIYEQTLRPVVKSLSNETSAQILRSMHPLRVQRSLWSSHNPIARATTTLSKSVTKPNNGQAEPKNIQNTATKVTDDITDVERLSKIKNASESRLSPITNYGKVILPEVEPITEDNLFLQLEKTFMDSLSMTMGFWGDMQAMFNEITFFGVWSTPWMRSYGKQERSRRLMDKNDLRTLPKVEAALSKVKVGGYTEAVIRMLILANIVADDIINRDELIRLTKLFSTQAPFKTLSSTDISEIIHEQTLIARFAEADALSALPSLIRAKAKRLEAYKQILYVVGEDKEGRNAETNVMLDNIKAILKITDKDI